MLIKKKGETAMKVTRTFVTAHVSVEIWKKTENGIKHVGEEMDLFGCDSREKAEIMLSKKLRNQLYSILAIRFTVTKASVDAEKFLSIAELQETVIDEQEFKKEKENLKNERKL